ncbi:MAG: GNAT family N-acetyltransferase [Anaerolineales bacterium]|nr:GNAT family N-acetyltransferase [Anaerolineales bacterium]
MKTEYLPFTEQMIPEAGNLLAQRHKRNRASLSLLPPRFEDTGIATKAIEALWKKKFTNGYAAFRNGNMTAYLLGHFVLQPWARCGYVYLPGYALADGESTMTIQDLYVLLGDDWVKKGIFSHGLYISAADVHVIDALFSLGFGKERVDGLMDLSTMVIPEIEEPAGIIIRQAGKGDNDHLGSLSHIIMSSLANAPYWHPTVPEDWEDLREGWAELADEKDWTVWMALEDKQVLGSLAFHLEEEDDIEMLISPRTTTFTIAATKPEARGRGIGTALTWHGLEQARKEGFGICYTDWISPNLPASRFWPRFGLKDVAYRLSKRVDPMIAWTKR